MNSENIDYKEIREKFIDSFLEGKEADAVDYLMQCPINPHLALAIKHVDGIEALAGYNLCEAKRVYPEEFK